MGTIGDKVGVSVGRVPGHAGKRSGEDDRDGVRTHKYTGSPSSTLWSSSSSSPASSP